MRQTTDLHEAAPERGVTEGVKAHDGTIVLEKKLVLVPSLQNVPQPHLVPVCITCNSDTHPHRILPLGGVAHHVTHNNCITPPDNSSQAHIARAPDGQ